MILSLCACGGAETNLNETPEKTEITITFVNGSETLGTVKAYAGEKITGYEQFETLSGYEFLGWYKTPTMLESSKCDLTTDTFNSDKKIFGAFKSLNKTADTRKWYVVGEGASTVLVNSAWAGADVTEENKSACELKATGNTNEFAITLDLYAGDKFQLIYDWQWEGQKGYGTFTELSADEFESGGGLSGETSKANVMVKKDGNYTITLTTDPDNSVYDEIKIVRNGDAGAKPEVKEEVYTVNENTEIVMKGSWVSDWSENISLTRTTGTNLFTVTREFASGTELYFMVWDNGKDTGKGLNASAVTDDASKAFIDASAYNVKLTADGTYTITVDADTFTIKISK